MDKNYMLKAIEISKLGSGFVNPKPLVGAIIVKDSKVIGQGYLKNFDSLSAINMAINSATESLDNSTLYINIESDFKELLETNIKNVVVGTLDPIKNGQEIETLKTNGISVTLGILKEECEELNEIYIHYSKTNTPFVFTKWAMTLDGKLATKTYDSKWISSDDSLKFVHHLRQQVSAIMVGENTVKQDNPMLTTRLEGIKISNPLRVILSKYGDLPLDSNIFKIDKDKKTLILCSSKIQKSKEKEILKTGAKILKFEEKNGHLDFKDIITALGNNNIDSLYIEGGSAVLASAFESKIVNKVYAAVAPKIIGGKNAITPVSGNGIEKMRDAIVLNKVSHEIIGNDVIIKGYIS
ncbi:diaminohydroxyphosphoribosylaminopyrimidine deaminase / 5-amino-6-(5-phosphoribosylamino)uracil reductase [Clostridium cavendishii DSM 21758]|uniref:Riboflavin biosynthesis protein RibD n=1 Tax=Clostridium cavendishii DSM 21758 TaxID=1121302 RepID=A0A1M6MXL5_9CLOT|nr:bifunctional diaminohydroxyphosphoribosylaminopyrimidine deaminase/5-amino-6-(5-phosphoribosylamino)uracil reductase RibD [Clostridium cavendishii]SHJ88189.1 diaminohydroxyphosphoribosylaminopyrimidine deaminase / 5-amino-6-(5-phosphoribosylamino)uracil reductase [Clostridium cavendishii DSM 21758]